MECLSKSELIAFGFTHVGKNTRVSRVARFYDINGSIGDGARVDDFAIITGNVSIGKHTHISPFCFLAGTGGQILMEEGSGMSAHVSVFTKSDDYREQACGTRRKVTGDVVIGKYSILGAQCVILPGVTIGNFCSIGVGCVLQDDVADASRLVSMGIKSIQPSMHEDMPKASPATNDTLQWLLGYLLKQYGLENISPPDHLFEQLDSFQVVDLLVACEERFPDIDLSNIESISTFTVKEFNNFLARFDQS